MIYDLNEIANLPDTFSLYGLETSLSTSLQTPQEA